MKILKIDIETNNEDVVYDLEVADNHNYYVEDVLVSNCHGASQKSKSIRSILDKCSNAYYRIGLTGTLPTADIDRYNIFGYLGPKLANVDSHELIERGILSKIDIYAVFMRYSELENKMMR